MGLDSVSSVPKFIQHLRRDAKLAFESSKQLLYRSIESAGTLKDESSIERLKGLITSHHNPDSKDFLKEEKLAIVALLKIGTKDALDFVDDVLNKKKLDDPGSFQKDYIQPGLKQLSESELRERLRTLEVTVKSDRLDTKTRVRTLFVEALGGKGDKEALDALIRQLTEIKERVPEKYDFDSSLALSILLNHIKNPEAVHAVSDLLKYEDHSVRMDALQVLKELDCPEAPEALFKFLMEEKDFTRYQFKVALWFLESSKNKLGHTLYEKVLQEHPFSVQIQEQLRLDKKEAARPPVEVDLAELFPDDLKPGDQDVELSDFELDKLFGDGSKPRNQGSELSFDDLELH